MNEVELRDKIERAFDSLFPKWNEHVNELLVKFSTDIVQSPSGQHRTFPIGPVTPFKVDYYRGSHGLTLTADNSHPGYLEVLETAPIWMKPFMQRFLDFLSEQPKPGEFARRVAKGVANELNAALTEQMRAEFFPAFDQMLKEAIAKALVESLGLEDRRRLA